MDLSKAGVMPERTADPAAARALLERNGAAILTDCGRDAGASEAIPALVFGANALAVASAVRVSERDRRSMGVASQNRSNCHSAGCAYGWQYPDYFLLLCDVPGEVGGGSLLVDGYAVLDAIAADAEVSWLAHAIRTTAIDQTENSLRPLVGPLVSRSPTGRKMLVMADAVDQRPVDDSRDPAADAKMIERWRSTVSEAADQVEHFELTAGEAVIVDNYRLFHATDPHLGEDRRMWRVWTWTDAAAFGVPDGALHSDGRDDRLAG